ncbi:MAG TPA: nickel-responsive transcriptional regulator NikR [Armatimonadota bacterium]|jgi:CopG family nickel-responsive transcriptional regulator
MADLQRFGVSMPAGLLAQFDAHLESEGYANRSEALRDLIRDHLVGAEWAESDVEVVGVISLVYDHHALGLGSQLNEEQHEQHDVVLCSTHVHLDEHNCAEVIVAKGKGSQVQKLADRLIALRGVKHGRLVSTTTGEHLE